MIVRCVPAIERKEKAEISSQRKPDGIIERKKLNSRTLVQGLFEVLMQDINLFLKLPFKLLQIILRITDYPFNGINVLK